MVLRIQVIEDFTENPIRNENLKVRYNRENLFSVEDLKRQIYEINSLDADLFFNEYQNSQAKLRETEIPLLVGIRKSGEDYIFNTVQGHYKIVGAVRNFYKKAVDERSKEILLKSANPIGLVGITRTKDGYIAISERSSKADVPDILVPTPVGNFGWDYENNRLPTFEEKLVERAKFKAGFKPDEFFVDKPLVVARGLNQSVNPAISYAARVDLDRDQVLDRLKEAQKKSDLADKKITFLRIDERETLDALETYGEEVVVDNGLAGVFFYLKDIFGKKWSERELGKRNNFFALEPYSFRKS